jgi:hypothetical protein
MNIALNPDATADKSREATRKTNGQFETLTLDAAFSEAVRELAEKSVGHRRARPMTGLRMLSKQQWTLWRDLLTRCVRAQRR